MAGVNVRELAAFSASVARDAWKRTIKKPDGSDYAVWDQFLNWKNSVDRLQDDTKATAAYALDVKNDLDNFRSNKVNPMLADHEARLDALENSPSNPFPG